VGIFQRRGFAEPLLIARIGSDDERFCVLPEAVFARLPEAEIVPALQPALGRKVWLVIASEAWSDTEPLR
jgi:hypothetical protein